MPRLHRLRLAVAVLGLLASRASAQGPHVTADSADPTSAAARLERLQARVVQQAIDSYKARPLATAPTGWQSVLRDVERAVERPWIGLPPVILVVPGTSRGFACDERHSCLGRFLGANLTVRGADTTLTVQSSIILLAESALTRPDVWSHELTHALLTQHGMLAESARHDRRYFAETQFVTLTY